MSDTVTPTPSVEKPMTASERKALEKLIDGDFDALDRDLQIMANEATETALKEVRESYAPKGADVAQATQELVALVDAFNDQKQALEREFRDAKFALIADWKERGIIHQWARDRYGDKIVGHGSFTFDGLADAETEARKAVQADLLNARRVLEKQRTAAHREILLGGLVSSQARSLVDSIPDAKALFSAAVQDQKALEVGK